MAPFDKHQIDDRYRAPKLTVNFVERMTEKRRIATVDDQTFGARSAPPPNSSG